jgi:tetratricopeptide (TPR) repeat protein
MKNKFLLLSAFVVCFSAFSQNGATTRFLTDLEKARKASAGRNWSESVILWEAIITANPVNGEYRAMLGDAAYSTGAYAKSIEAYKKQIELGFGRTDIAAYNIACCYALSGHKTNALVWLKKSFKLGYSDFANAQRDPDLKSLHGDPVFEKLVMRVDPGKLNRANGWLYDLNLMQWEIDRKSVKGEQFDPKEIAREIAQLKQKISTLNDNEIILEIMRIMRKMNDGHSWAMPSFEHPDFRRTLPLLFYQFSEGLYVIAADPKYKDLLGSQVLEYAGITIDKFTDIFDPYIMRDNQNALKVRIPYILRTPEFVKTKKYIKDASSVDLKIRDMKGNLKTVNVKADTTQPNIWNTLPNPATWVNLPQTLAGKMPLYLKDMGNAHWWEAVPEMNMVYCQVNKIRNTPEQSFAQFVQRLFRFYDSTQAEKLVIDMRWNNGGNTMLVRPLIDSIIRRPELNKRGNLYVIIGRRTYSAAQNTATYLERFTNPIFVGEPTGSSPNFVGEEEPLILPYSKTIINVSDLYWQSSFPFDKRTWIAPLLYAPPGFEYFKANRDPAMEAILEYVSAGKRF